jgi:aryl-alcohol dehydrogenase-like predicted oxidoreductase
MGYAIHMPQLQTDGRHKLPRELRAVETDRSVPQLALNGLLQRPTVTSVLVGARNEAQLRDNLGAIEFRLDADQMARLDAASAVMPPYPHYPYWNGQFTERNPPPVATGL